MREKNGFTLVELLVVIAIISVLAAMLLPALSSSLESARQIECANKLRQVMIATHQYEMDQHCMLPQQIGSGNQKGCVLGITRLFDTGILTHEGVIIPWGPTTISQEPAVRAASVFGCPSGIYHGEKKTATIYLMSPNNLFNGSIASPYGSNPAVSTEWYQKSDGTFFWGDTPRFSTGYATSWGWYPAWNPMPDRTSKQIWMSPTSFAMSDAFKRSEDGTNDLNTWWLPITSFDEPPSKKLTFIEGYGYHSSHGGSQSFPSGGMWWLRNRLSNPARRYQAFRNRHNNGSNFACYDGHVGYISGYEDGLYDVDWSVLSNTNTGTDLFVF